MKNIKFDFDDILIKPSTTTNITSRQYASPFINRTLPLISAPMDRVYFNYDSYKVYTDNGIITTIPRNGTDTIKHIDTFLRFKYSHAFVSISLQDLAWLNKHPDVLRSVREDITYPLKLLIDIANGHIDILQEQIVKFRTLFSSDEFELMVGNIANPLTYKELSDAGADYVRISIGSGSACLTSQQTAIGYPMASLIEECYDLSCTLDDPAYIVADGGFNKYSDIIKALVLGADYVMIGSILNKAFNNGGICYWKGIPFDPSKSITKFLFDKGLTFERDYRGMSTKEVQRKWGKTDNKLRTSEGISKMNRVEYTVEGWVQNFTDYLRSAMSYTNSFTLKDLKESEYIFITQNSHLRFKK